MRLVVADTGPVHYLILIDYSNILPQLFNRVYVPAAVRDEMVHPHAPDVVRTWMISPPSWIEVLPNPATVLSDPSLMSLDEGEKAAVALAGSLNADLILMDDREGTLIARRKGFAVVGTIGILDLAAKRGQINLPDAFARLKATNFRYPQRIIDALLAQHLKLPRDR